jgi:hypothetical protein
MGEMTERLLRRVLSFYSYPGNWAKPFGKFNRPPRAVLDAGKLARAALKAKSVGAILCTTCDVIDMPLTKLGRQCGILDPRMAEIARGKDPSEEEFTKLVEELDKAYKAKFPRLFGS